MVEQIAHFKAFTAFEGIYAHTGMDIVLLIRAFAFIEL